MTYRELLFWLNTFTPEQLDTDVTIYDYNMDEAFPARYVKKDDLPLDEQQPIIAF